MKLVTGCAGFIGSNLVEALLEKGHKVRGIDNFDDYYSPDLKKRRIEDLRKNKNFEFYERDIRGQNLKDVFQDVDVVYHLAALAGVRPSIKYPAKYIDVNVTGTANLLENSLNGVEHFVFASSSSVYGDKKLEELPVKENARLGPIAPYPESKVLAENLCERFSEIYGLPTVSLRYFTVYGPRQRPDEAVCKFTKLLLEGKQPPVYGDGKQSRDFTYVDDITGGTVRAAESKAKGVFNLGSGEMISVNEMVELLRKEIGTDIKPKHVDEKQGDVRHTWADISKARKGFGYEPKIGIREGIRRFVKWFKQASL